MKEESTCIRISHAATLRRGSIGGLSPRGLCVQTAACKPLWAPPSQAWLVACQSCDTAVSQSLFVSGWRDLAGFYLDANRRLTYISSGYI